MPSPSIIHQRHTDPDAALARARNALRDEGGSIPRAATALECSAGWLRKWVAQDKRVAAGIALRPRGREKGKPGPEPEPPATRPADRRGGAPC